MFLTSPRAERDPQAIDHSPVKITAAPPARPDPTLLVDERRLLRQLRGLLERQTQDEPFLEARCKEDLEQLQLAFDTAYQEVIVSFVRRKEELERQVKQNRITIKTKFEGRLVRLETSFETGRGRIREAYRLEKEAAKAEYKETRWTATAMYDGVENQAEKTLKETTQRLEEIKRRLETTRETSLDYLTRCHMPVPEAAVGAESLQPLDLEDLNDFAKDVKADGADLARMKLPAFFRREGIVWLFLGLWLALAYPGFWAAGLLGIAGSGGVALVGAFLGSMVLRVLATGEVKKIAVPLFEHIAHGLLCEQSLRRAAVQEHQRLVRDSREKLAQEVQKAVAAFMKRKQTARDRRSVAWNVLVQETQQRRQATKTRRDRNWKRNENYFRDETASNQSQYEADSKALYEENCRRTTEFETQYASAREEIRRAWDDGMRQVLDGCRQLMAAALENSPPWEATSWEQSTPLAQMPATLSLGTLRLALEHLPRPLPGPDAPTALEMPALLPFPPAGSFLVTAPRDADQAALAVVQQLLMRWLTSAPPGKFRITFVDPLGLGQNFASFMHLADHDEMLVSGRIWTEPAQIEQRLADLSAHMEHVIQKYLRNQYASIEEYNVKAGEVAEPYRLLVISHFPTNFTVDAVRRLASILQSGPRCGVYTLIYFDSDLKLLNELPMAELQRDATCLVWNQDRFVWKDPDFERTTFVPAPPPPEGRILHLLHKVGEAALANKRVQVPFSFVAPAAAARWHTSAAAGLDVAIGRAGATRRQYLRLGQGTAQHALIAGKTGSGKSTLLHALVTNLALTYSPREAELYLIDFKKGVEFKTYATHLLPHARVIAIESEREFGLSVLERLLGEMDRRAELFRKAGVQDLKSFRQLRPAIALPRILLIVDEFQEFFIEEDVLADKAASHLDRLVRQGRAFGLHLVLGSQTLGGAYTLARSTIDQMAVRIALQCSETDGHLILSEENHAARLQSTTTLTAWSTATIRSRSSGWTTTNVTHAWNKPHSWTRQKKMSRACRRLFSRVQRLPTSQPIARSNAYCASRRLRDLAAWHSGWVRPSPSRTRPWHTSARLAATIYCSWVKTRQRSVAYWRPRSRAWPPSSAPTGIRPRLFRLSTSSKVHRSLRTAR